VNDEKTGEWRAMKNYVLERQKPKIWAGHALQSRN